MRRIQENFICDRCGKEIKARRILIKTDRNEMMIDKKYKLSILKADWRAVDLCDTCEKSFSKWWKGEQDNE